MRAYAEVGFDGLLRPNHVLSLYGESNDRPGYGTLERLFVLGRIRGAAAGRLRAPDRTSHVLGLAERNELGGGWTPNDLFLFSGRRRCCDVVAPHRLCRRDSRRSGARWRRSAFPIRRQ